MRQESKFVVVTGCCGTRLGYCRAEGNEKEGREEMHA